MTSFLVLAEHNIEYNVYDKFMRQSPGLVKHLLAIDINKIKREEEASWKRANGLIAVSQEDKKVMEEKGFKPSVVSNGVNTDQFVFIQEATLLLAPIRVGGGTSYKVLESMSCGTPVVTMSLSAQAIGAKDGHDIMVGSTAAQLAEKTASLLNDSILYEKLSKNARVLIEKNYTWKKIAKNLEDVYKNLI